MKDMWKGCFEKYEMVNFGQMQLCGSVNKGHLNQASGLRKPLSVNYCQVLYRATTRLLAPHPHFQLHVGCLHLDSLQVIPAQIPKSFSMCVWGGGGCLFVETMWSTYWCCLYFLTPYMVQLTRSTSSDAHACCGSWSPLYPQTRRGWGSPPCKAQPLTNGYRRFL